MDTLSHGIWAGLFARFTNIKVKRRINVWWTAFFGVFPDLFAFTIPFTWLILNLILGNISPGEFRGPESNSLPEGSEFMFGLASNLYNLSHSLIIFGLVYLIVTLIRKKQTYEMFGWLLHILIDIPTHTRAFYPTPIFWPTSSFKFSGINWANKWFMIINITAMVLFYVYIKMREKRKKKKC